MTAAKELPVPIVKASWVAVIYNPAKERSTTQGAFDELMGQGNVFRPPVGRYLLLPVTPPDGHITGQAIPTRNIFLRVGANLTDSKNEPIPLSDWELMLSAEKEKARRKEIPTLTRLIEQGAFQVYLPESEDGSPGYRNFSSPVAMALINATAHEDWLDTWMQAEIRAEIIKAAAEQRQRIIANKKRQAS